MPTFVVEMRVTHHEIWEVEAKDEDEARRKIIDMDDDVIDDETGGDIVDMEIRKIRRG
jgi:hypothetical protein